MTNFSATDILARDGQLLIHHLLNVSKLAAEFGSKFGLTELLRIAGLLHDYGKVQPEFQDYLRDKNARRGEVKHSIYGAVKILGDASIFKPAAEIIANIIAAHHAKLQDFLSPEGETPLQDTTHKTKPLSVLFEPLENELTIDRAKLKNEFININQRAHRDDKAFGLSMLTRLVYSCLVDADRLDAFLSESGTEYKNVKPDWDALLENLNRRLAEFKSETKIEMAKLRQKVSDECAAAGQRDKGIYKLEVPTGGGKTLASLRFALNHAKRHNMDRVIYVIPYLSILSQTAAEIRRALNADEATVLEHHSGFLPDDEKNYKLHTDRWDATVILTTQVQFLESVFSAKGGDLRKLHNMADAVLIFDEAQSIPIKCVYLFNGVVNFLHGTCGSTVLLCTATQPRLDKVSRPARFSSNPSIADCGAAPERTRIVNAMIPGDYSYPELAAFVSDKHQNSTLVIVNTKAAAKSLYVELKQTGAPVLHLSTNMCAAHRDAVIKELRRRLDKKEPVVCVSTQLIEAGVDISFECVIRDIAGLDSIYQAAGRCNRHGEFGEVKPVYVVKIRGENLERLKDIQTGAKITAELFNKQNETPDINEYYRKFFFERQLQMTYPVPRGDLYDWLTMNECGKDAYLSRNDVQGKAAPAMWSAIRSAADEFFVIDRGRTDAVVPYGDGLALLEQYLSTRDISKKRKLLQRLGGFSVSLYKYQVDALDKLGALYFREGITVLSNGFYDAQRGVDLEGEHEFLYL